MGRQAGLLSLLCLHIKDNREREVKLRGIDR